jgi:hypothetical protein
MQRHVCPPDLQLSDKEKKKENIPTNQHENRITNFFFKARGAGSAGQRERDVEEHHILLGGRPDGAA